MFTVRKIYSDSNVITLLSYNDIKRTKFSRILSHKIIWDSSRQNEPSYIYIKCYKIPLCLNRYNF